MWPFKKKEEDIASFERELGLKTDIGMPEIEERKDSYESQREDISFDKRSAYDAGRQQQQSIQPPVMQQQNDLQVISAKLDTIKAMLDLMNQRLNNLERNDPEKPQKKYW